MFNSKGHITINSFASCLGFCFFFLFLLALLLFRELCKFLVELVNSAGCIHILHLTGIKRVRVRRYLQFDQGIFLTIFPFNCFACFYTRPGKKSIVAGKVFKDYHSVIIGMNILFHGFCIFFLKERKGTIYHMFRQIFSQNPSMPGKKASGKWCRSLAPDTSKRTIIMSNRNSPVHLCSFI